MPEKKALFVDRLITGAMVVFIAILVGLAAVNVIERIFRPVLTAFGE
jgi:hypothetical protein